MDIAEILRNFAKENRKTLALYVMLSLAFPISEVVLPYYYGKIIESVSKGKPKQIFKRNRRNFYVVIGLWFFNQVLYSSMDKLDVVFIPKLQSYVRKHLIAKILHSTSGHYDDPEVGKLIAQLVKLPAILRDLFHQLRNFILPSVLVLVATTGYLLFVDVRLGMLGIFCIMIFFILLYTFVQKCFLSSKTADDYHNKLCEESCDLLSNMINIFAAGREEEEIERLEKIQETYDEKYRHTIDCAANFKTLFNSTYFAMFVGINGYATYLYSKKEISLSSASSILIIMLYVMNHLGNVSGEIREFIFNIGCLQKTQENMDVLTPLEKERGIDSIQIKSGDISLQNAVIQRDDNFVLKISAQIRSGERVAIVGKVGSGKSTLIGGIMGYYPLESGEILIDGSSINACNLKDLRRQISYIPQTPRLFNRSIYENIVYGADRKITAQEVKDTLKSLNITQISHFDLTRKAGKNGSHLSGGQKQIIYLLRCILSPGKIVILDEPTASLDEDSKAQVLELIRVLCHKKTTLIVTHDPECRKLASRHIELIV